MAEKYIYKMMRFGFKIIDVISCSKQDFSSNLNFKRMNQKMQKDPVQKTGIQLIK